MRDMRDMGGSTLDQLDAHHEAHPTNRGMGNGNMVHNDPYITLLNKHCNFIKIYIEGSLFLRRGNVTEWFTYFLEMPRYYVNICVSPLCLLPFYGIRSFSLPSLGNR